MQQKIVFLVAALVALFVSQGVALAPVESENLQKDPEVASTLLTGDFPANFHAIDESETEEQLAVRTLAQAMGASPDELKLSSKVYSRHNGVTHLYFHQLFNGIECPTCVGAVHLSRYGEVVAMSHSGLKDNLHRRGGVQNRLSAPVPRVSALEALLTLADYVKAPLSLDSLVEEPSFTNDLQTAWESPNALEATPITSTLAYTLSGEDEVQLAWRVQWQTACGNHAYDTFVSAEKADEIISHHDLVKWDSFGEEQVAEQVQASMDPHSYNVYQMPALDPIQGDRQQVNNPADQDTSPLGWHNNEKEKFTETAGNNAYSQENWRGGSSWEDNYRPDGGSSLKFDFPVDFNKEPKEYADAAIANLHFWNNLIHDVLYLRGFDEESGNFQESNFNKGGLGNDAVQANAQDGAGYNNANFMTPADGQRPRMRMYLWNHVRPMVDGDLDSQIIVHEYMHGVSNRLTGGPQNVRCLGGGQSGGMGEGWGDWVANMFSAKEEHTPEMEFPMGLYAAGRGIRYYPYSGSFDVNPQTYGVITDTSRYRGVHAIGSVWSQVLFQVYWEMRNEFGFDADWYYGKAGNNVLLQNVMDGMKLQPCNPNFVDAREAIMKADELNYGGRHVCTMWKGFAARGVGYSAQSRSANDVTEAFDMPPQCA